jgi:hypothetical protein
MTANGAASFIPAKKGRPMNEAAEYIGRLRRWLRPLLPRIWFTPCPQSSGGMRARRPSIATMELDPEAPASGWVAWEVSRPGSRRSGPGAAP